MILHELIQANPKRVQPNVADRLAPEFRSEEDFLVLDEEFHIQIAEGANLPIVAQLLEQMRGFARLMRLGRSQPPEHLQDILEEHTRIVEALEQRDVNAALRALNDHLHHWDHLLSPTELESTHSPLPA